MELDLSRSRADRMTVLVEFPVDRLRGVDGKLRKPPKNGEWVYREKVAQNEYSKYPQFSTQPENVATLPDFTSAFAVSASD